MTLALTLAVMLAVVPAGTRADEPAGLLDALRASHDPVRQLQIVDEIGRTAGPAAPASALKAQAPAALLALLRDGDVDWSVRGEVLHALRTIDAPDDVVAQAIDAAKADEGDHAGYLRGLAAGLQTWRDARANSRSTPADTSEEARRRARLVLHDRGIEVSMSALAEAVGSGESGTVAALITAGLPVDGKEATSMVTDGLATACSKDPVPTLGVSQSLSVLVGHGFPVDWMDESGNTLLMSAAQFCPGPVAAQLLALGAKPDTVNKQHFTPLQMALVSGKWDVAKVLVDAGARITKQDSDQIFFQPPEEPSQRELLARATR